MARKNGIKNEYRVWATTRPSEILEPYADGIERVVENGEMSCGLYAADTEDEAIGWAREENGEDRQYRAELLS